MSSITPGVVAAPAALRKQVTSRSPGRLAWDRFRRDTKTVIAAVVVLAYVLLAIAAPFLVALGVLDPFSINQDLIGPDSLPIGPFGGISWEHPFGIQPAIGRDTLSRVWFGLTFSLAIALIGSVLAMATGVVLGIIAGLTGGWVDTLIGRLIDLTLSFPQTLMLLALSGSALLFLTATVGLPEGDISRAAFVILVLAVFGWVGVARVIRGQVLSIREREYIEAAKLIGASPARRWFREVLPNLWAPILVQGTLMLPAYISTEAALAYLTVSIQQPTPTLGNVLQDAVRYPVADFTYFIIPVIVLVTLVVAFNLLGDGLRDALDPKGSR
ncbi:ABC transporter permease [Pseudolysinimonas sp.]|jgi:peptide/nickel transport system permease protein|uniref:ABC transporter permease n=1 Tax=Pseudolysinimonas sp. TaxID=2680009 RepID=UPI0037845F9A